MHMFILPNFATMYTKRMRKIILFYAWKCKLYVNDKIILQKVTITVRIMLLLALVMWGYSQ